MGAVDACHHDVGVFLNAVSEQVERNMREEAEDQRHINIVNAD